MDQEYNTGFHIIGPMSQSCSRSNNNSTTDTCAHIIGTSYKNDRYTCRHIHRSRRPVCWHTCTSLKLVLNKLLETQRDSRFNIIMWRCISMHLTTRPLTDGKRALQSAISLQPTASPRVWKGNSTYTFCNDVVIQFREKAICHEIARISILTVGW